MQIKADVLDKAISACLVQQHLTSQRAVAFWLRKLLIAKANYFIYNKKMLAIINTVRDQKIYAKEAKQKIKVLLDYKNLIYFAIAQELFKRQFR